MYKNFRNKKAGDEMNHRKGKSFTIILVAQLRRMMIIIDFKFNEMRLASLTDTYRRAVILSVTQKRDQPDSGSSYLGKRKIE